MCKTDKKTRNYIFFLCHVTKAKKIECKNEFIFDFRGQNETEYNRISIILLKRIALEKIPETKGKRNTLKGQCHKVTSRLKSLF